MRLARAMLRPNARLVILDEPFRGLDRGQRRELLKRARAFWQDATLLYVTHDIADARSFERVLVMDGGRVVQDDAPQALAAHPESRYRQLLDAEEQVRAGLWSGKLWRRLQIRNGHLIEGEHNG